MNLIVVTHPATEPVTLDEVSEHLRLDDDQKNVMANRLHALIVSSRAEAENITGRAFIEQTLMMVGDRVGSAIQLLRPPIIEIESVSYYDMDNVLTAVDASYFVTEGFSPVLRFPWDYAYPTVYSRPDAFRIRYRAGYLDDQSPPEANVPEPIKQAILLGVELHYGGMTPQERDAIEKARNALLAPYVVHAIV